MSFEMNGTKKIQSKDKKKNEGKRISRQEKEKGK